jgi:hypothetical protein
LEKKRVCSDFSERLEKNKGREIVEDTQHKFWGRGGKNNMGLLLMEISETGNEQNTTSLPEQSHAMDNSDAEDTQPVQKNGATQGAQGYQGRGYSEQYRGAARGDGHRGRYPRRSRGNNYNSRPWQKRGGYNWKQYDSYGSY